MERNTPAYIRPFLKIAGKIIDIADKGLHGKGISFRTKRELQILYPDIKREEAEKQFRITRLANVMFTVLLGGLLLLAIATGNDDDIRIVEGSIVRGGYNDGDRQVSLEIFRGQDEAGVVDITIGAREYEEKQLLEVLDDFRMHLPELIRGQNPDLYNVTEDLCLLQQYEGYPFTVSWYCRSGEYLSDAGELIKAPEQDVQIWLEPIIMYGSGQWENPIAITLLKGETDEKAALQKYLLDSEADSRKQEKWVLPSDWNGQDLHYKVKNGGYAIMWISLLAVGVAAVFLLAEKDLHEKYVQRQRQLKEEYPELLHRMVLYIGAGMTIRGCLYQISREYSEGIAGGMEKNIAFEELGYVCREIRTGVSEADAYERFGQRTGVQEYIRLCTLLIQNLQKGSGTLAERLREEAGNAQTEYLQLCKKAGEEADTKLLVPLVLMLLVVMLMILIPAFQTAGI